MDQHFAESKKLAEDIEGMMSPFSMAVVDSLLAFQQLRGITGDILEMGVYHGKSAAILGRRMAANETLHLYDIADYFDRKNLERVGVNIKYNIANTQRLFRWNFRKQKKSIRFCHIDASHMFDPTVHEMAIADYVLANDGIVCLDDYTNLNYSQILAATFKYLFTRSTNLTMFLVTAEKAYLCRKSAFPMYGQFVLDEIRAETARRGVDPCLARTDATSNYRAFYLREKEAGETDDIYGRSIYGHFFITSRETSALRRCVAFRRTPRRLLRRGRAKSSLRTVRLYDPASQCGRPFARTDFNSPSEC